MGCLGEVAVGSRTLAEIGSIINYVFQMKLLSPGFWGRIENIISPMQDFGQSWMSGGRLRQQN